MKNYELEIETDENNPKKVDYTIYDRETMKQVVDAISKGEISDVDQYIAATSILKVIFGRHATVYEVIDTLHKDKNHPEHYLLMFTKLFSAMSVSTMEEKTEILETLVTMIPYISTEEDSWVRLEFELKKFNFKDATLSEHYDDIIRILGIDVVLELPIFFGWKYITHNNG